jgi:hypothetical protein
MNRPVCDYDGLPAVARITWSSGSALVCEPHRSSVTGQAEVEVFPLGPGGDEFDAAIARMRPLP